MAERFVWMDGGFVNPKHVRAIIGEDRPIESDMDKEGELPAQKYRVYISSMEMFRISYVELRRFMNRNRFLVPHSVIAEGWETEG